MARLVPVVECVYAKALVERRGWEWISEKRTKNQAKTDKTEHGMKEREKAKFKSKPKTKKSKLKEASRLCLAAHVPLNPHHSIIQSLAND
ncbi:hypothetical protein Tco_0566059 [Tanacetum coccineum]